MSVLLRRVFVSASLAWALLLVAVPFLASRAHLPSIAAAASVAVYAIGSLVCHQLPQRSYRLWAAQMPVCARCTGIYAGAATASLVALPAMFAIGLAIRGRLFPFDFSDPLVGLEALADLGIGVPYFIASALGYGAGDVRAVTYEYGNAFLVVAGLLNLLVVIDAYDVMMGRK